MARFVTRLDLVNDVNLAFTANHLARRVTLLGRLDRGNDFHKRCKSIARPTLCQRNSWNEFATVAEFRFLGPMSARLPTFEQRALRRIDLTGATDRTRPIIRQWDPPSSQPTGAPIPRIVSKPQARHAAGLVVGNGFSVPTPSKSGICRAKIIFPPAVGRILMISARTRRPISVRPPFTTTMEPSSR